MLNQYSCKSSTGSCTRCTTRINGRLCLRRCFLPQKTFNLHPQFTAVAGGAANGNGNNSNTESAAGATGAATATNVDPAKPTNTNAETNNIVCLNFWLQMVLNIHHRALEGVKNRRANVGLLGRLRSGQQTFWFGLQLLTSCSSFEYVLSFIAMNISTDPAEPCVKKVL